MPLVIASMSQSLSHPAGEAIPRLFDAIDFVSDWPLATLDEYGRAFRAAYLQCHRAKGG
jgi:hypothetical protein